MKKVIIAPDSFKGSIDASTAARAIAQGIMSVCPDAVTVELPIADGGEGTLKVLTKPSERFSLTVARADGEPTMAEYGIVGQTAIIEMASAAGLVSVPENMRDPEASTTKGVGHLILDALNRGCRELMLTVGGSGTNDGGIGMLEVLGAKFYAENELIRNIRARDMHRLTQIDISGLDPRLYKTKLTIACDVNNPLCGESGATYVYGRQKGADNAMLERLESGMKRWAAVLSSIAPDVSAMPGTGAGGGIGFPLVALFASSVRSGIDSVLEVIDFEKQLDGAALVITGEGKLDRQSAYGKAISGVAEAAKRKSIPVLALVGVVDEGADELNAVGVTEIRALTELTADQGYSIAHADELLRRLAERSAKKYLR